MLASSLARPMLSVLVQTPGSKDQNVQLSAAREVIIGRDRSCDLV